MPFFCVSSRSFGVLQVLVIEPCRACAASRIAVPIAVILWIGHDGLLLPRSPRQMKMRGANRAVAASNAVRVGKRQPTEAARAGQLSVVFGHALRPRTESGWPSDRF